MEILQTGQKYQTANDIKALLRKYIAEKKLEVADGLVKPDRRLTMVAKDQPFKIVKFVSILRSTGNLDD